MTRVKTTRLNPRGAGRRTMHGTPKKVNRRKLSPEQIRYFGTARQRAALGRKRATKRAAVPHRRKATSRSRKNPAWLLTMAPVAGVNPRKETKAMPATKKRRKAVKKSTAKRKHTRRVVARSTNPKRRNRTRTRTKTVVRYRKSNPKVVVRYRTKRHNRRRAVARRKNPDIFGSALGSKDSLKMIGGGIVGVAAVKLIPTLLPANMIPQIASSSIGKLGIAAVTATVAGWAAGKLDKRFGEGVMFGGWMMVAAVGINIIAPSVYTQYIGMGDFVPGRFPVPQNPVRGALPAAPAAPAASGAVMKSSRLGSAYQPAY